VHSDRRVFRFGPFELDADRRRLARGGKRLSPSDRQMDVLVLFAARPDRWSKKRPSSKKPGAASPSATRHSGRRVAA
jgi:DNA-binding response OmpR family regulator